MPKKTKQEGQSLLEVIFALFLVSLVAIAIVGLATISIRNNINSKNSTESKRYAQQVIEWLRKERDTDWSLFYTHAATPVYCLKSLDFSSPTACDGEDDFILNTKFIRQLTLTKVTGEKVTALVTVDWNDSKGTHTSSITTYFTKW